MPSLGSAAASSRDAMSPDTWLFFVTAKPLISLDSKRWCLDSSNESHTLKMSG